MAMRCPECGSERIAAGVRLGGGPKGGLLGRLRANVCADCGHTDLHADDPMDLYLRHQRAVGAGPVGAAPAAGAPPAAAASNIQCPSCGSVMPAAEKRCEVCGWSAGPA